MLFSLFFNALMLLDETVSPSRALQRLITWCEKKYFLTSFCHLGLLSLAKWPRVPLLLQSKVNRDSKWTVVNPLYILKWKVVARQPSVMEEDSWWWWWWWLWWWLTYRSPLRGVPVRWCTAVVSYSARASAGRFAAWITSIRRINVTSSAAAHHQTSLGTANFTRLMIALTYHIQTLFLNAFLSK